MTASETATLQSGSLSICLPEPGFLEAWDALAALGPQWWPEVGRMDGGTWYCELCLGNPVVHLIGPGIRCVAPTATEAIHMALAKIRSDASPN